MEEALNVLEDCLYAGDNAEQALATVAADFNVDPRELAEAFKARFGQSYLTYTGE